jgi:GT2 family glycosyltransferase
MPLSVDIVIPVYGQWELTQRCLASLAVRDACVRNVIVVDDASPDDSAERLRARTDIIAVILDTNGGFAKACNAGARASTADAVFFLNNDTIVRPGAIDRLAATMNESGAAAVGPALLNGDGTLQVAGLALLANATRFTRLYTHLDADLPQAQHPYAPVALSGAALLVRRTAFEAAGAFHEAFVNGSEDVDLCLTLWAAGETCCYEPRATIEHVEGASRGKTASNAANDALLQSRWANRSAHLPRYTEPLAPLIDLRWKSSTPLDAVIGNHLFRGLKAYGGARVIRNQRQTVRIAALLDGRASYALAHGDRARADVAWCAPETAREAALASARDVGRFWVPSPRSAALLIAAGVDAARVAVTRVGFAPNAAAHVRALTSAIVVSRTTTADAGARAIAAALGTIPAERLIAEEADDAALARIAASPLVVFADAGDAWGFLGTAALAGGALVVAPAASPFLDIVPADAYVAVDDAADLANAVRNIGAKPATFLERGPLAARELARRNTDQMAAQRVRELGRALVHGVIATDALTMNAERAGTLRASTA